MLVGGEKAKKAFLKLDSGIKLLWIERRSQTGLKKPRGNKTVLWKEGHDSTMSLHIKAGVFSCYIII